MPERLKVGHPVEFLGEQVLRTSLLQRFIKDQLPTDTSVVVKSAFGL